jgi:hypothetical protein
MEILSRVMTSWGGMSNVTVLRLILNSLSIPGMMKINPGPFAPMSLPRRKMTPRSYSLRILMAEAAKMNKKMMRKKKPDGNPGIPILYSLLFRFF